MNLIEEETHLQDLLNGGLLSEEDLRNTEQEVLLLGELYQVSGCRKQICDQVGVLAEQTTIGITSL